jgi:hypothetical protein
LIRWRIICYIYSGAIIGKAFSRERKGADTDQSQAGKLDYPTQADQDTSIAALARAQIAVAKDSYTAAKDSAAHNERSRRVADASPFERYIVSIERQAGVIFILSLSCCRVAAPDRG